MKDRGTPFPPSVTSQFLAGNGEMVTLIRTKDWSNISIGSPENWPTSLRTVLGIILHSKFPMFLWWGTDLTCFYNDAYRPSLGKDGKHPSILGMPARNAWPEIWTIIEPLIQQVLDGGDATWSENQLIPIYRNGTIEDVYWTFSYSPVRDETDRIAGVLVTCSETTENVLVRKQLEESNTRLQSAIDAAELGTWDYDPVHGIFTGNQHLRRWFGLPAGSVIGLPLAIRAVAPKDRQRIAEAIRDVLQSSSGGHYEATHSIISPHSGDEIIVRAVGKVSFGEDGIARTFTGAMHNVTEETLAQEKITHSEQNLRLLIRNAPVSIAIFRGPDHKIEVVNDRALELWGRNESEVMNKPLLQALPELQNQGMRQLLDEVYKTGKAFSATELPVPIQRRGQTELVYMNFLYEALFDANDRINGIITVGTEVTTQVNARKKLEESERRFRNTVLQAPLGITIFRGPQFIVEMANETYLQVVGRDENSFVGKPLFDSLPEVRDAVEPLLKNVLTTGEAHHGIEFPVTLHRYGKQDLTYFNFVYHPMREETGDISGIIVVATEVTETVRAKHFLGESEKQFRNLVLQSPIPMAIIRGPEYVIEMANKVMFENIWRKKEADIVGRPLLDVFPELNDQKYPALLGEVFRTGKTYRETEALAYVRGDDGLHVFYLDYEYAPLLDPDNIVSGLIITVNDVTEKVSARRKVESAEERLRLATEATELATWELDLNTREILYSPRLLEIFGRPAGFAFSHPAMRKQIHPEDLPIVEKAFDVALQTGIYKYEVRMVRPDGDTLWVRTQGKVFYDENGQPVKMIGTLRDMTEEKSRQQVLQESEKKFRLLADSISQLVWTWEPGGELNYSNQSVYDFSGIDATQLKAQGWLQIVHPDEWKDNLRQWKESLASGNDFIREHRFLRHDGQYRWHLSRATPQRSATGGIQLWVGSSTDIQELKELDEQKDYFISMASHELKTPLTSIKGHVQILQRVYQDSPEEMLKTSLKVVDRQIVMLTNLISDLLDLSKIKSGVLFMNKERFPINELVQEMTDEIRHINPDYVIHFAPDREVFVLADRERIGQVVLNFLTNAVKYSPHSHEVRLDSTIRNGEVVISVQDAGIGISKSHQQKIFQRFYRVEGENEKTFPGFGIGLFISAEIIHRHQGRIGVQSEPGKGSLFFFSLPVIN